MNLVVIYGPPGVGKLTVAKELASLTGYKLFDNHASIDTIKRVFEFGSEPFWRLVHQLRFAVIEEAARQDVSLIFTTVYAHPEDVEYLETICGLVERHDGRACLVRLYCDREVLEERVQAEDRANKLDSVEVLQELLLSHDLLSALPGRESLTIDNTELPPDEVARQIAAHYGLSTT